jgi:hypothetical protein
MRLDSPTAVVHLEYDPTDPPQRPEVPATRFVCLSDTHSRSFVVPPGDVLLHGGDLTSTGTIEDFERTMTWLYSLPHKHKIIIAGNHDLSLHRDWYQSNFSRWHFQPVKADPIIEMLKGSRAKNAGIVYLEDEKYEFDCNDRTWSVYGSPWSPYFYNWAFNYRRPGRENVDLDCPYNATDIISSFPKTDILLTHSPPFGVLDRTYSNQHVGCEVLSQRLQHLRPKIHLFGHIHEAHGAQIRAWEPPDASHPLPTAQNPIPGSYIEDVKTERTVFVNGANWPSGEGSVDFYGKRVRMGEGRFCPVIVDLLHEKLP